MREEVSSQNEQGGRLPPPLLFYFLDSAFLFHSDF